MKRDELNAYCPYANRDGFYHKSEADKVIAHQKYKRCLAMARWCKAMCGHYLSYEEPKWFWYRKWSDRWLELAEKLKPNKSTAQ